MQSKKIRNYFVVALLAASNFLLNSPTWAEQINNSDYLPQINLVEKYPDQGTAIIHWEAPLRSLDDKPITDYAYRLSTPISASSSWTYMDLNYVLDGTDFSYTISSLVRCNLCAANLVQIAAVSEGIIQAATEPIQISYTSYTPEFKISSPVSNAKGFTFKIINVDGILDYSQKPALSKPYFKNNFESVYYGPYYYKVTSITGAKKVTVIGPNVDGEFDVIGLTSGQKVKITLARKPNTCSIYPYLYCSATRTVTVVGSSL
jgi:hypothetical protein